MEVTCEVVHFDEYRWLLAFCEYESCYAVKSMVQDEATLIMEEVQWIRVTRA